MKKILLYLVLTCSLYIPTSFFITGQIKASSPACECTRCNSSETSGNCDEDCKNIGIRNYYGSCSSKEVANKWVGKNGQGTGARVYCSTQDITNACIKPTPTPPQPPAPTPQPTPPTAVRCGCSFKSQIGVEVTSCDAVVNIINPNKTTASQNCPSACQDQALRNKIQNEYGPLYLYLPINGAWNGQWTTSMSGNTTPRCQ